jgi:hypothetical protein
MISALLDRFLAVDYWLTGADPGRTIEKSIEKATTKGIEKRIAQSARHDDAKV